MSQIDDLPPLRDVILRYGISPAKALGQNFILDLNLTARIARAAGDLTATSVIEVGPGPGGLTRALLAAGAGRMIAIERDARCLAALAEIGTRYPDRLTVIAGDALTTDMAALAAGPTAIISNLPYNVATPLLVGWLKTEPWPPWYSSMTLMFQREVAERIVAGHGSKTYGRLSVLAQWRTEARLLFDIDQRAFTPPPKVTSSLVHFTPRPAPMACDPWLLERMTTAAFGQRRKMLRQSLKTLGVDAGRLLQRAGIDETERAEDVDVAGFVGLARALAEIVG
jgi:16S rRNA (adenine1518-N6/adenine1519-N6)-dimethyltransferase